MNQLLKALWQARAIQIVKIVHVVDVAVVVAEVDASQAQAILTRTQALMKILKMARLKMTVPALIAVAVAVALPEMVLLQAK
jgi:hypothetical protein